MNLFEMGCTKALEDAIYLDTQILRSGDFRLKAIERIQIGVIEPNQEICLRESVQLCEIARPSRSPGSTWPLNVTWTV